MILILLLPQLLRQVVPNHRGPDGKSLVTPSFNSKCWISQKDPDGESDAVHWLTEGQNVCSIARGQTNLQRNQALKVITKIYVRVMILLLGGW